MDGSRMRSSLSMVEAKLPPGFRFHPRDEELICDYLMKKVAASANSSDHHHHLLLHCPLLIEVDLNKCEPWDIPESACVGGKEWYFYSLRDRKYATGLRTNRATMSGYWKATGKDRAVFRGGTLVGMRKTLVFYQGRAPKGKKTDWVMHEFRLEGPLVSRVYSSKEDLVLCRVFYKHREVAEKPSIGRGYDAEASSSSLPPLMETFITFKNQTTQASTDGEHSEQVPCFSISTPSQLSQNQNQTLNHNLSYTLANSTFPNQMEPSIFGGLPDLGSCLSPLSCDKNTVIKAVLNHFTKMETDSPNLIKGDSTGLLGQGSSESFFSDVGLPPMWSHCQSKSPQLHGVWS